MKLIERYNLSTPGQMIELLELINDFIGYFVKNEALVNDESFQMNISCTDRAKKKAKQYKCSLYFNHRPLNNAFKKG